MNGIILNVLSYTLYNVHYTKYTGHNTLYTVQYIVQCTLAIAVQCTLRKGGRTNF